MFTSQSIRKLYQTPRFFISKVYTKGEISTDLLITLSMNQNSQNFKSHNELINSLVLKNFLKTEEVIESFRKLDRAHFFNNKDNLEQIYLDKPVDIGNGQSMTSPMMHGIAIEALYPYISRHFTKPSNNEITILDIGAGSGYTSFIIYDLILKLMKNNQQRHDHVSILGIDLFPELMIKANLTYATLVEKDILGIDEKLKLFFKKEDLFQLIINNITRFDVINVGAAVKPQDFEELKTIVKKRDGAILAPVIRDDGEQNLILFDASTNKEENIMRVVYSPAVKGEIIEKNKEIEKYFIKENKWEPEKETFSFKEHNINGIDKSSENKPTEGGQLKQKISELENLINEMEMEVKGWIQKLQNESKSKISFKDMQKNKEICELLLKIQTKKREKSRLQNILNIKP